jgi:hypothetical protein
LLTLAQKAKVRANQIVCNATWQALHRQENSQRGGGVQMTYGMRRNERVRFDRGIEVYMMGIDGTWRRDCRMIDVSQTGALLSVAKSIEGLDLSEFFLLLSSTGLAYRRCKLIRVMGDEIGVEFLAREIKKPIRK